MTSEGVFRVEGYRGSSPLSSTRFRSSEVFLLRMSSTPLAASAEVLPDFPKHSSWLRWKRFQAYPQDQHSLSMVS
jgi:hypothetical protein